MRYSSTITHGIFCGHHFLKAHDKVVPGLNLKQLVTPFPAQPQCHDTVAPRLLQEEDTRREKTVRWT